MEKVKRLETLISLGKIPLLCVTVIEDVLGSIVVVVVLVMDESRSKGKSHEELCNLLLCCVVSYCFVFRVIYKKDLQSTKIKFFFFFYYFFSFSFFHFFFFFFVADEKPLTIIKRTMVDYFLSPKTTKKNTLI